MAGFLNSIASSLGLGANIQLGIDIGAASVKVVAVKNDSDSSVKVVGASYEETPPGCVVDGVLSDPRAMVTVVQDAIKKAGIRNYKGMNAAVGLRGVGVMFRRIMLPYQNSDEMGAQVVIEAQQQIETDLSEWIVDFQTLTPPDRQGQCAVMLVGAKRSVAEDYTTLLGMIGLKPQIFDCDVFASANALEHALGGAIPDTTLILDIGRDTTKFHLIQDAVPLIVRSFPTGGLHLTELVAKNLSISYDEAEVLKISASNSETGHTHKECETAFRSYLKDLSAEIKQTIDFFANSNSDTKIDAIDKIFLCGGGARTRGLPQVLSKQFHTEVKLLNPFRQAILGGNTEAEIGDNAHIFPVAFGLAMRETGDRER
jgi:type IV pilus assembly protein PilM